MHYVVFICDSIEIVYSSVSFNILPLIVVTGTGVVVEVTVNNFEDFFYHLVYYIAYTYVQYHVCFVNDDEVLPCALDTVAGVVAITVVACGRVVIAAFAVVVAPGVDDDAVVFWNEDNVEIYMF